VYPRQCVTVGGSSEAVVVRRVERLDNVIGLKRLDDVTRVRRDGGRSDEAKERWGARALVLWLWF
jgi:hypothetical protein